MGRRYPEHDESKRRHYDDRGRWRDLPIDRANYGEYDPEPYYPGPNTRAEGRDRPAYISGYASHEAPYPDYGRLPAPWDRDDWGSYEQGPLRSHLRCRDMMTRAVVTCRRDTPIRQIAKIMQEEDTGAVPVVSADTTLDGIVTDRDIVVRGLTSDRGDTELEAEDCIATDISL